MTFRVEIAPSALMDAEQYYLRILEDSPTRAAEWFNGLLEAIYSLEEMPRRCVTAYEAEILGLEIRQLLYENYRILFGIEEQVVKVYRIRHPRQNWLTAENFFDA